LRLAVGAGFFENNRMRQQNPERLDNVEWVLRAREGATQQPPRRHTHTVPVAVLPTVMEVIQMSSSISKRATLVAGLAGCMALAGTAFAQTQPSTPAHPATPDMANTAMKMPSATPSKSETAASAFAKLDASHRGYITKQDTAKLEGFDKAFKQGDKNKDGKLTLSEFNVAWSTYTGNSRKG
jgi:hypothetical protein